MDDATKRVNVVDFDEARKLANRVAEEVFSGHSFHAGVAALMSLVAFATDETRANFYTIKDFCDGVEVLRRLRNGETDPQVGETFAVTAKGTLQ